MSTPNSVRSALPALLALFAAPTLALVVSCGDDGGRSSDHSDGGSAGGGSGGSSGSAGEGGGGGAGGVGGACDRACSDGEACLEGECQLVCRIGDTEIVAGEADPANACARCDPAQSTSEWSTDPDGTVCGTGQICVNTACTSACLIDGEVHAAGFVNPANACEICDPTSSASAWSPRPSFELLVGGIDVEAQGWSIISQPVNALTSEGDTTQLTTSTEPGARTGGQLLLSRSNAYEVGRPFRIRFDLLVASAAPHNTLDSGAAILGSLTGPFGTSTERSQMIYLDEGAIGWADDSQSAALDTTDASHVYELTVDADGQATVSVDGIARLARSGFVADGTIAIGDQTNDPNVDGTMQIRSISRICP